MAFLGKESTIALKDLDAHLKAIVKLKIREFVHLSPWFHDLPGPDPIQFSYFKEIQDGPERRHDADCPNYRARAVKRPKAIRRSLV
jgi:hypothetical protein